MGLIPKDAREQRSVAERLTRARPFDVAAWIALSQACQVLVEEEGTIAAARKGVQLDPENIDALRQLATSLDQMGPGQVEARPLFEKLLELAPYDLVALHYMYRFALFDGALERAIEYAERTERIHPGSPFTSARIARVYKLMGNQAAAEAEFARAAERCEDKRSPFPLGPYASSKPLFTALAGDNSLSESLSLQLCQRSGIGLANLSHPRYPSNSLQSIINLQGMVAGRDLFIFGNGPSLAEASSRREEIASLEFVPMTMSSFQIAEEALLHPIGKRVELVCMTHPTMATNQGAAIAKWFSRVPNSILAMPLWAQEVAAASGKPQVLLKDSPHLFWYDSIGEHLPSPAEPLHVPALNTLLCALSVGILARPRRIFLFGFDGKIKGQDSLKPDALYFQEHHAGYHMTRREEPNIRQYTMTSLWWDSMLFNETAAVTLRQTALLFNLPQPPIYNVCVDSALDPFPRISFDRFKEIVSG
jgi:hypothetical protein